jgi:hypothetical protein
VTADQTERASIRLISRTTRERDAKIFEDRDSVYPAFGQVNHKLGVNKKQPP